MSPLEFVEELPESRVGRSDEIAEQLQANPYKWARWPSSTGASAVRKSLAACGPGFEAASRKVDGKYVAFVRYVPPQAASEPTGNGHAATPPVESGTRPRVKCPTCSVFVNIEPGEDGAKALTRHESTNVTCKAANRRRR